MDRQIVVQQLARQGCELNGPKVCFQDPFIQEVLGLGRRQGIGAFKPIAQGSGVDFGNFVTHFVHHSGRIGYLNGAVTTNGGVI